MTGPVSRGATPRTEKREGGGGGLGGNWGRWFPRPQDGGPCCDGVTGQGRRGGGFRRAGFAAIERRGASFSGRGRTILSTRSGSFDRCGGASHPRSDGG